MLVLHHEHLFMLGREEFLLLHDQLLAKPLTRPEADHLDRHVPTRL